MRRQHCWFRGCLIKLGNDAEWSVGPASWPGPPCRPSTCRGMVLKGRSANQHLGTTEVFSLKQRPTLLSGERDGGERKCRKEGAEDGGKIREDGSWGEKDGGWRGYVRYDLNRCPNENDGFALCILSSDCVTPPAPPILPSCMPWISHTSAEMRFQRILDGWLYRVHLVLRWTRCTFVLPNK